MTDAAVRKRRLRNQRLTGPRCASPEAAVHWLTAVQSQDYTGAKWALGLRGGQTTDAEIDAAFDAGRILRTHVMRPTWHFVSPDDIRWMLALTAPRVHACNAYYYRALEITPETLSVSRRILERELRDRHFRTRTELADALARGGLTASGTRLALLLMHAELEGVICSGPRRGKQFTYALLDERAPNARHLSMDEALTELLTRYIQSHGPATLLDFSWWSGLRLGDAKRAVQMAAGALVSTKAGTFTLWMSSTGVPRSPSPPAVLLLPNYDEYFVAYKDRVSFLGAPPAGATNAWDALTHVLALDGGFGGTWRRTIEPTQTGVDVHAARPLTAAAKSALEKEGARLSAFLGRPVRVAIR